MPTRWLQIALILLVGGSTNNWLSVTSCSHSHEKSLFKIAFETYILYFSVFYVMIGLWTLYFSCKYMYLIVRDLPHPPHVGLSALLVLSLYPELEVHYTVRRQRV
jgi:hypothetical protein